tara:strand:+ start:5451 stop:5954 length:504 start_codon:yes stop_codon:yes gene_type:complete
MSLLDKQQKLDLHNMINANETEDVTEKIRENKQSHLIRTDIKQMLFLKQKYTRLAKSNPNEFDKICVNQCQFLFNNYTDIFNKIKTDTLNLTIMDKFLNILKKIEDGELDQHEGSYLVGKHLKELYIDSALRNQQKMETKDRKKKQPNKPTVSEKIISYKDFKKMQH